MTQLPVTSVRHQRPTPTVHLAGSFILSHVVSVLQAAERQRRKNVLTLVFMPPTVVLPSGIIGSLVHQAVGYTGENRVVRIVNFILTSYSLTSSERVSLGQVGDASRTIT